MHPRSLHSLPVYRSLATAVFLVFAVGARADVVNADDFVVQGSLAVGIDTVNNESFGFDTIRLKENNTRLSFIDTSTGAGFATNDWTIVANDSGSGGRNYLGFRDKGADGIAGDETGKLSFYIMAGAGEDALMVDSSARVGLGTANPTLKLHLNNKDTPGVRLEQNDTGGFTAQTWDVAGNEANFFVRDVTGGSNLPFRIRPGAPTSSIDIAASGAVGLGISSPRAKLDIAVDTTNLTEGVLIADSHSTVETNAATLHVEGTVFVAKTLEIGSSRERKENIHELTLEEAAGALAGLKPMHFNYKADTEHQLGFIAEDVPDLVATQSRKSLVPMDFVAVLTKVVQNHEERERALEKTIASQQELLQSLAARLDALEKQGVGSPAKATTLTSARREEHARSQDGPEVASALPPKPAASSKLPSPVLNNGR